MFFHMKQSTQIRIAALVVFIGVALGAFGAHGLHAKLVATGHIDTWKTAAIYQLIHGVAMLAMALHSAAKPRVAFWSWLIGIILFSGSLYALSLTGFSKLGAITPLGGLAFLIGWASLVISPLSKEK